MSTADRGVPAGLAEAVRFGEAVRHRRHVELGLSHADVQRLGGPSISAQSHIENGKKPLSRYNPGLLRRLEIPLQWADGSVAALRRGEEPTPAAGRTTTALRDTDGGVLMHRVKATRGLDVVMPALRALSREEQEEALAWLSTRLDRTA